MKVIIWNSFDVYKFQSFHNRFYVNLNVSMVVARIKKVRCSDFFMLKVSLQLESQCLSRIRERLLKKLEEPWMQG